MQEKKLNVACLLVKRAIQIHFDLMLINQMPQVYVLCAFAYVWMRVCVHCRYVCMCVCVHFLVHVYM